MTKCNLSFPQMDRVSGVVDKDRNLPCASKAAEWIWLLGGLSLTSRWGWECPGTSVWMVWLKGLSASRSSDKPWSYDLVLYNSPICKMGLPVREIY